MKLYIRTTGTTSLEVSKHRLITKKLCNLYERNILLTNTNEKYINLPDYKLKDNQKEYLNLGTSCHLQLKFDPPTKRN